MAFNLDVLEPVGVRCGTSVTILRSSIFISLVFAKKKQLTVSQIALLFHTRSG
jgi:hypothetical protein